MLHHLTQSYRLLRSSQIREKERKKNAAPVGLLGSGLTPEIVFECYDKRALVYFFFDKHNKDKLDLVHGIIEDYKDDLVELLNSLLHKYKLDLEEWVVLAKEIDANPEMVSSEEGVNNDNGELIGADLCTITSPLFCS